MRLVAPVPLVRRIVRLSDEGERLSARRSPRRGRVEDIFNRLVSIPALLCHPRFELELLLTHQDELRVYRPGRAFPHRGWVAVGRRLVSVEDRVRVTCPDDAARLLPPNLPTLFDTAQLADAAAIDRRLAQVFTRRAPRRVRGSGPVGGRLRCRAFRRSVANHQPLGVAY